MTHLMTELSQNRTSSYLDFKRNYRTTTSHVLQLASTCNLNFQGRKEVHTLYTSTLYKALLALRGNAARCVWRQVMNQQSTWGAADAVPVHMGGSMQLHLQETKMQIPLCHRPICSTTPSIFHSTPALSPHRTPKLSVPSPLFHFPKAPPGITVSPSFSVHLPHTTWPRTTSHFFSCRWWSARSVAGIPWGSYGRIQVENAGISAEFCTKGTQYQSSANKYWQASTSWLQPKWLGLTPPTSLPIPPKQFGMGCRRCSCPPHRLLPQPSSSPTPPSLLSMTGRQSFWQMTLEDGEIWGCCYLLTLQWQDGLWFCRQLQEWTWTDLEPEFCRNIWHFKKRHRNQDR